MHRAAKGAGWGDPLAALPHAISGRVRVELHLLISCSNDPWVNRPF